MAFWKTFGKQVGVKKIVAEIHVRAISMGAIRGVITCGCIVMPCVVGRSGRSQRKVEGDGFTPSGRWQLRQSYWRSDRGLPPQTLLRGKPLPRALGWCDGPGDRNYNRAVILPYQASHEEMWRSDHLYDVVVTLSHNEKPRVQGLGSAVFLHIADPQGGPTAGCVAVSARNMRVLLRFCGPATRLVVWPVSPARVAGNQR